MVIKKISTPEKIGSKKFKSKKEDPKAEATFLDQIRKKISSLNLNETHIKEAVQWVRSKTL